MSEITIEPGEYFGGDTGATLYTVTVCDECGLPVLKVKQERIFLLTEKGIARKKAWQADKKKLPYDLDICECGHNQEEEED